MKKLKIIVFFLLPVFATQSCKSKPKEEQNIVKYDKSVNPLETDNIIFKKYSFRLKEPVTLAYTQGKLSEILSIAGKTDQRFIADSSVDKESNYISFHSAEDPSAIFEIDKRNGKVFFNAGLKQYKDDKATEGLPSENEVIKLTENLISKLNLPDVKQLAKPDVSYLEMSVKKDQEQPQVFRKMISVRYGRIIENLPVEGASRLNFNFGRNAELTTLIADWHTWDESVVSKEQVFTAKELEKQIERTVVEGATGLKQIIINKRQVVLYDDGHSTMEPAVYVQAVCTYARKGMDGKEETYDIPRDFYQPILKSSTALFPSVKDRQIKVQPNLMKGQQDTIKNRNTIDE